MTKLSDDWGWGRSQKTGESGLIPIVIMEDVVREREKEERERERESERERGREGERRMFLCLPHFFPE